MMWRPAGVVLTLLLLIVPAPTWAQSAPAPAAPADDDPDRDINVSQPDFTIITLPTTLRVPRHRSAFRVTHRFNQSLTQGDFGDQAESLFGIDAGASIGLEYRFGVIRGLQVGLHRTNNRTIDLFSEYNVWNQRSGHPVGINALLSVDGTNNFRDVYSPTLGVAVSRELGNHGAVYVEPMWIGDSNPAVNPVNEDDDTFMVGIGLRLRIRPTVYLVGEIMPRTGYSPGANQAAFAIEKRAGGHSFQLNFSNGLGTTPSQIARGGTTNENWYLGFNIARKFF
ncbi:MAG TPA: DUF5777 family beta-barrel protein [Planctomycetaceae bacterium]|nr:DUF5777 family beta-barrel protein [Planctomycetaceae bacterium]